jgi:hypothetical protein
MPKIKIFNQAQMQSPQGIYFRNWIGNDDCLEGDSVKYDYSALIQMLNENKRNGERVGVGEKSFMDKMLDKAIKGRR